MDWVMVGISIIVVIGIGYFAFKKIAEGKRHSEAYKELKEIVSEKLKK